MNEPASTSPQAAPPAKSRVSLPTLLLGAAIFGGLAYYLHLQQGEVLSTSRVETQLDENGKQWRQMLDQGVQQAARVNRDLRDYIHKNS